MKTTDKPIFQEFHIEGVKQISPADAMIALNKDKAVLIDVREPDELALESVLLDNVLNHPMSVIMDRLPYIASDQNIILACPAGVRSVKVANLLNREDYPGVTNLDGGLGQWKAQGFPYEQKLGFRELPCVGSCSGCSGGSCC